MIIVRYSPLLLPVHVYQLTKEPRFGYNTVQLKYFHVNYSLQQKEQSNTISTVNINKWSVQICGLHNLNLTATTVSGLS